MEYSSYVNFNDITIPKCPFLWNYENQFIHPIIEHYQTDFNSDLDNIITNINNNEDKQKILKFNKNYFIIKQKILFDTNNASKNKINLSFHSWYFSKISKYNDNMTKIEFNVPLHTCIISKSNKINNCDKIIQDQILFNEFTLRKICVHNKKLSPANSNTFFIFNNNVNEQIEFYSICYSIKIKNCVITKHIMILE